MCITVGFTASVGCVHHTSNSIHCRASSSYVYSHVLAKCNKDYFVLLAFLLVSREEISMANLAFEDACRAQSAYHETAW